MYAMRCLPRSARLWSQKTGAFGATSKRHFENILRNDPSVRDDKVVTFDNHATDAVLFTQVSTHSFLLSNGVRLVGPCFAFHRTVLSWKVLSSSDINERSLLLMKVLVPKVDLLVIGKGSWKAPLLSKSVLQWLHDEVRVPFEVLPTDRAVELYNFLNAEGRLVAAALIPPGRDDLTDELMDDQLRQRVAARAGEAVEFDADAKLSFTEPFKKSFLGLGDVMDDLRAVREEEKYEEDEKRQLQAAKEKEATTKNDSQSKDASRTRRDRAQEPKATQNSRTAKESESKK